MYCGNVHAIINKEAYMVVYYYTVYICLPEYMLSMVDTSWFIRTSTVATLSEPVPIYTYTAR